MINTNLQLYRVNFHHSNLLFMDLKIAICSDYKSQQSFEWSSNSDWMQSGLRACKQERYQLCSNTAWQSFDKYFACIDWSCCTARCEYFTRNSLLVASIVDWVIGVLRSHVTKVGLPFFSSTWQSVITKGAQQGCTDPVLCAGIQRGQCWRKCMLVWLTFATFSKMAKYSFKSITQSTQRCHVQSWDLCQRWSLLSWIWKRWHRACHTIVILKKLVTRNSNFEQNSDTTSLSRRTHTRKH